MPLLLTEDEDTPGLTTLIKDVVLDDRVKGMPGGIPAFPLGEIGRHGWNVLREDLPLPLAVLKESAVEHNSRWMRRFLKRAGAVIAPHGKTTMSPQLFRRQLADGAWAITIATAHQLQVCRRFGIQRIVLANQLVGRRCVEYVLEELGRDPDFDFYCFVDSVEGVRLLADTARDLFPGRPLQVLLELGFVGGRTGARTVESAIDIAQEVRDRAPYLSLRGASGFEGLIPGHSPADKQQQVTDFLAFVTDATEACDERHLFAPGPVILSAGGSAFYDLVVKQFARARLRGERLVVVRSGCYLTHDSQMYVEHFEQALLRSPELAELGSGPRAALELWAYVQSRPEPERAILAVGKRDCSFDAGMPRPLEWFRPSHHDRPQPLPGEYRVVDLNDQHAFLSLPVDSPLTFGDMVMLGISHPCTTFDKWQVLPVVNETYDVVGGVHTYF